MEAERGWDEVGLNLLDRASGERVLKILWRQVNKIDTADNSLEETPQEDRRRLTGTPPRPPIKRSR